MSGFWVLYLLLQRTTILTCRPVFIAHTAASQPASQQQQQHHRLDGRGGLFFEDGIAISLIVSGAVLLRCEAVLGPLRCFFFYSTVFTSGCIPSAPCWPFIISY